jgi:hypothetical protein
MKLFAQNVDVKLLLKKEREKHVLGWFNATCVKGVQGILRINHCLVVRIIHELFITR